MKKKSAGFLIKSKGLYLLCHATQLLSGPSQFDGKWTISKGRVEDGETDLEAAIRELREETNISILDHFSFRKESKWFNKFSNAKREVIVFLVEDRTGILRDVELKCNSVVINHPIERYNGIPEMDAFMWVTGEEAIRMVFESQRHLFLMEEC
jgi:8-oxo-dGTP pyrophosphatase MutT (NUDIX family)